MQYLNTFLNLLAKTQSRDKLLRIVQYATLYSEEHVVKGPAYNVYVQMRRTRKILRFLRTLQYSSEIRKDVAELSKSFDSPPSLILKIFTILENLFTVLFYLCDHRVFLGELEIISKQSAITYYPRSMKMYLFQNIFGVVKNIAAIAVLILEGKHQGKSIDMDDGAKLIKSLAVEIIRNILDIFVANYYINKPGGQAARIGAIGVITSIIGICQSLKLI